MRARLIHFSTPKYRSDPETLKQWIRPHRPILKPAPRGEAQEVTFEFNTAKKELRVDGCQPLQV